MNMLTKTKAKVAGVVALVASGVASATPPAAGFDTGPIVAQIQDYGAKALVLISAFLVIRWGIKATGLLRPRG